jgi:hypothetical protein
MFDINYTTGAITLNRGDTGSFLLEAHRDDQVDWTEDDRAVFTVRNGAGDIVIGREYRLDDDEGLGNGIVLIEFHNSDTDELPAGAYSWEVRYVVNVYRDSDGAIVDGDIVRTPGMDGKGNPMSMTLNSVLKDI